MPDTPSIVIVKSFPYRGVEEEFSNRYHFSGTTPTNHDEWKAMASNLISLETPTVPSIVQFVQAYGYAAGTEHSVAQIDFRSEAPLQVGTFPGTLGGFLQAGDCAATIRWDTGQLNSRGKKIYCRKYMHAVYRAADDGQDELHPQQLAAFQVFATHLIDSTLSNNRKYCGPQGAVLSNPVVDKWLTTRTLKRRGKRPLP